MQERVDFKNGCRIILMGHMGLKLNGHFIGPLA
jgi:hypothetical protein